MGAYFLAFFCGGDRWKDNFIVVSKIFILSVFYIGIGRIVTFSIIAASVGIQKIYRQDYIMEDRLERRRKSHLEVGISLSYKENRDRNYIELRSRNKIDHYSKRRLMNFQPSSG